MTRLREPGILVCRESYLVRVEKHNVSTAGQNTSNSGVGST
ncbi:MAG: hypothetical protein H6Q00_1601 [Holophagaceae bacterium]|nr:hypothetical protein [Holophagaceae bacterium]